MTVPIPPGPVGIGQIQASGIPLGPSRSDNSFADTLKAALGDVSQLQGDAKDLIAAFVRGEPVEVHQVMAAAEEAALSLELLVEIRNKLTEAYRTVMNMQV